jgi:hypothetical protein
MARKRRSYRRAGNKRRRSRKGFGLPKLLDVSQILVNAEGLGYINATELAMQGKFKDAAYTVANAASSPGVIFGLALDNTFIGIGRKVIHATGGKWVRKVIA